MNLILRIKVMFQQEHAFHFAQLRTRISKRGLVAVFALPNPQRSVSVVRVSVYDTYFFLGTSPGPVL